MSNNSVLLGLKVLDHHQAGWLLSPQQQTPWHTHTLLASGEGPITPARRGVHAFRRLDAGTLRAGALYGVIAVVRARGEVVVGEQGWVAEGATIERLLCDPTVSRRTRALLRQRYGVPVIVRRHHAPADPERPLATALAIRYGPGLAQVTRTPTGLRLLRPRPRYPVPALYDPAHVALVRPSWERTQRRRACARRRRQARRTAAVRAGVERSLRDGAIRSAAEDGVCLLGRQPGCTISEIWSQIRPVMQRRAERRRDREVAETARRGTPRTAAVRRWRVLQERRGERFNRAVRRSAGHSYRWPVVIIEGDSAPERRGHSYVKYCWRNYGARGTVYHPSTYRIEVGADWLTRGGMR